MEAVQNIAQQLDLNEELSSDIDSLLIKAKIDADQGRQKDCKLTVVEAIRVLIKAVADKPD